jgi:hypothetical protein
MAITPSRALHTDGSNCFNRLTSIGLAGTLTADNTSLTFTAVVGHVVIFTENCAMPPSPEQTASLSGSAVRLALK